MTMWRWRWELSPSAAPAPSQRLARQSPAYLVIGAADAHGATRSALMITISRM
jgi:hypothetical protein